MENGFRPGKLSLLTLLLSSMMILMAGAAVAPALPEIGQVFSDYDELFINFIITMPPLAIVVSGFAMGVLADRIGKVKVLVLSLAIFGASGLSGFVLEDLMQILVGRFGVGIGIAGISCCTTALISEYYTGVQRNKVLGYQAAAMGAGAFILELFGGVLADFGWHYPFLIYGIGLLLVLTAIVSLREPGNVSSIGGEMPVFEAPSYAKPLRVFCYLAIFLAMLFMYAFPSKLPEYMADNLGSTPLVTGLMLGAMGISTAVVSMLHRNISASVSEMSLVMYGFISIGVSGLFFFLEPSYPSILLSAVSMGIGMGLITPALLNTLAGICTPMTSGKIMGGYTTFLNLGQFLSAFVLAVLIGVYGGLSGSVFYTISFMAFAIAALTFFAKLKLDKV